MYVILFSGNRKLIQRLKSSATFATRESCKKARSLPRIWGRHADIASVFLHACCALAGLYMVNNTSKVYLHFKSLGLFWI